MTSMAEPSPAVEKVARAVTSGGAVAAERLATEWPELTEALAALLVENGKTVPGEWRRPRSGKVW
jgi:hypothetical protein